jgi:2-polyprenyl-3-methyl-5-hydroxy-6-metoxy-1,4-benzoquinol methylase
MEFCSICNSSSLRELFNAHPLDYSSTENFKIVKCEQCGYVISSGAANNITLYESGSYDEKEKFWHKWVRGIFQILEVNKAAYLEKYLNPTSSVFEIGVGKGNFLSALRDKGYQIAGIEPSRRSFAVASQKLGGSIVNCKIEEISSYESINKKYNAIVLWHVLEHLQNPFEIIERLKEHLLQGGILMIGVPNFDSFQSRFGKNDWYHLDPSRHMSHFTPEFLTERLTKNNFSIQKIYFNSFYQNFVGEMITITNKLSPFENIIFNTLRVNKNYFRKASKWLAPFLFVYEVMLSGLLLIPVLFWTLLTQGMNKAGTMVCIARLDNASK